MSDHYKRLLRKAEDQVNVLQATLQAFSRDKATAEQERNAAQQERNAAQAATVRLGLAWKAAQEAYALVMATAAQGVK